jgi:hypothetical protein
MNLPLLQSDQDGYQPLSLVQGPQSLANDRSESSQRIIGLHRVPWIRRRRQRIPHIDGPKTSIHFAVDPSHQGDRHPGRVGFSPTQDKARLAATGTSDNASDSLVIGPVTWLHDLFLIDHYNSSGPNGNGTTYLKVFSAIAIRQDNVLFDSDLAVEISSPDTTFAINAGTIVTDARNGVPVGARPRTPALPCAAA